MPLLRPCCHASVLRRARGPSLLVGAPRRCQTSGSSGGRHERTPRDISRVSAEKMAALFPPSQRSMFPRRYRPSSGVASFLQADGIPLGDVLECYQELTQQVKQQGGQPSASSAAAAAESGATELREDFASDYLFWSRCVIEDFVEDRVLRGIAAPAPGAAGAAGAAGRAGTAHRPSLLRKWFRQWTSRSVLLPDATVRELFLLGPHLDAPPPPPPPVDPSSSCSNQQQGRKGPALPPVRPDVDPSRFYRFTPHAALQELALRPLAECRRLEDRVRFNTFPQLHNVFQQDWDSMSPLRALTHFSGEELVYTRELVLHLARYLQRALSEVEAAEPAFAGPHYHPSATPAVAPILTFFGNGRLAHELNALGVLPRPVIAVRLQRQAMQERRARQLAQHEMERGTSLLPDAEQFRSTVHPNFAAAQFPTTTVASIAEAMNRFGPSLVVVEPHRGGRDYFADLRGFHTVRRVVALGPVDGPGMGSNWFPFLSFGVTPGPHSYLVYNEHLQQVGAASRIQMPVDPPHELQGYRKEYLDNELSCWLLSPNDVAAVPHQYRALVFTRVVYPVLPRHRQKVKGQRPSQDRDHPAGQEGSETKDRPPQRQEAAPTPAGVGAPVVPTTAAPQR
eukprot:gene508-278_t